MSGLILLFALGLCFWLGGMLVRWVGQVVPNPKWKGPVKVALGLALIASPFVDEVIGMYQFNALCKANGIESADVSKARGKRVVRDQTRFEQLHGQIMPMQFNNEIYRDAESGVILIKFKNYYADGGWAMRYLLNFNGSSPILFSGNTCGVDLMTKNFTANQITWIN